MTTVKANKVGLNRVRMIAARAQQGACRPRQLHDCKQ